MGTVVGGWGDFAEGCEEAGQVWTATRSLGCCRGFGGVVFDWKMWVVSFEDWGI